MKETQACDHDFLVSREEDVKYRCSKCGRSGYRDPRTGAVVPHTENRTERDARLVLMPGGVFSDYGNYRRGRRMPGSY